MAAAATQATDDRPAGITCEKYVRGEGKRCRHYLANGGCALPDELMCVEWLKLNDHRPARPREGPLRQPGSATARVVEAEGHRLAFVSRASR